MLKKFIKAGSFNKFHGLAGLALLFLVFVTSQFIGIYTNKAFADELPNRNLQIINPVPSAQTIYNFNFDLATAGTLGSIKFEFCSNSPLLNDACVAPTGFSAGSAVLASQTGVTDFAMASPAASNVIIIGRSPGAVPAQSLNYVFDNVINQDITGTSYVRISTYASADATGAAIDAGGLAYPITSALNVATEVPQYLEFCTGISINGYNCSATTGSQINFGNFSTQVASSASSEFMAATNASYGYSITLGGSSLTSGNNVIGALGTPSASIPGTNQFGVNLRTNTNPAVGSDPLGPGTTTPGGGYNLANRFKFKSGDLLATSASSDDFRKFTVSYLVNISPDQPAGDYVSTMYFICLANF